MGGVPGPCPCRPHLLLLLLLPGRRAPPPCRDPRDPQVSGAESGFRPGAARSFAFICPEPRAVGQGLTQRQALYFRPEMRGGGADPLHLRRAAQAYLKTLRDPVELYIVILFFNRNGVILFLMFT